MKLKSIALAAALVASSVSSFAGTSVFSDEHADFGNDPFVISLLPFTQTITFSGLAAGTYDVSGTLSSQNINWTSVDLDGHSWTVLPGSTPKKKFAEIDYTGAAPLTLTLIGTTIGTAASKVIYSGEITVTAVPEPETYAMLLAGLGVMGAIARRRNKAA